MTALDDELKALVDGVDELKAVIAESEANAVSEPALNAVVELVALRAASLLESYLEKLFYMSILGEHPSPSVGARMAVKGREEADLLIFSEGRRRENYLAWLPFDTTLERSDSYLLSGYPFSWLRNRPDDRKALKELSIVRNAVAHPSMYAFTQLAEVANAKGYNVQRPADYLRSARAGTTEVLLLLMQVVVVGKALAQMTEKDADAILQPEAPFQDGQLAPVGIYKCARCEELLELESPRKLTKCHNCSSPTKCNTCGRVKGTNSKWQRLLA